MDPRALGRYLRESREAKELRIDDAVQALHIRRRILESFERGDFDVADTDVRRRGLLRNYARFLDLDEETILAYYDAAMSPDASKKQRGFLRFGQAQPADDAPIAPRRITDTPPALPKVTVSSSADSGTPAAARLGFVLRYSMMVLISLLVVAGIGFVSLQILTESADDGSQDAVAAVPGTPVQSSLLTPISTRIATSTPLPTATPQELSAGSLSGVMLSVTMQQTSWMRVRADEQEQFARTLQAGESFEVTATERVQMVVANAAAPQIIYNGEQIDPLGMRAQQVEVTFTGDDYEVQILSGGIQPTRTLAPPTATLPPDAPPTATGIPLPTEPPTALPAAATDASGTADTTESAAQPSPTPLFSEPAGEASAATPTLLFATGGSNNLAANTGAPLPTVPGEALSSAAAQPSATTLPLLLPAATTATPTRSPTETETLAPVVLPLRVTASPVNPPKSQ